MEGTLEMREAADAETSEAGRGGDGEELLPMDDATVEMKWVGEEAFEDRLSAMLDKDSTRDGEAGAGGGGRGDEILGAGRSNGPDKED